MEGSLLDNPILIKHVRSRLRRQHVLPMLVMLILVAGCIMWGGFALRSVESGRTFSLLVLLQGGILLLAGTAQVGNAVGRASRSGILDFHRASPLPPRTVALGFLVGAPIREYVAFAVMVPFTLAAAWMGRPGVVAGVGVLSIIVLSALLFHALAIVGGLLMAKARGGGGMSAMVIVACVMSPLVDRGYAFPGLLTPVPAFSEAMRSADRSFSVDVTYPTFFGAEVPLILQSLIYQIPLLIFLMIAASRRMRSARAHVYSKKSGTLFTIVLAALAMGGMAGHPEVRVEMAVPTVLCVVMLLASVVAMAVTPDRMDFAAGLRRAARIGESGAPPWDDSASNRTVVGLLALVTAGAGALTAALVARGMADDLALAMGIAASTVALFGWALQYFALAFGRRAMPYFMLFLFFTWVMPLLVGGLLGLSADAELGAMISRLCPIAAVISPNPVSLAFLAVLAAAFWIKTAATERETQDKLSEAAAQIS